MRPRPAVLISYGNIFFQSQSGSKFFDLPGQRVELSLALLAEVQLFEGPDLIQESSFQLPTLPPRPCLVVLFRRPTQPLFLGIFLDLSTTPLLHLAAIMSAYIYHYCCGYVSLHFSDILKGPFAIMNIM